MAENPYDYSTRKGIWPISWQDFHGLCKALAKAVSGFQPEVIVPIGRGGYYPGTLITHLLQAEVYPVRVSRRVNNQVKFDTPQWLLEPPALVRGKRVLIVDEICGSGETISMVKEKVESLGASKVRSAVLYAHTWGTSVPDYIGLVSDALLLNPWDREVLIDGAFQMTDEYVEALSLQGIAPDPSLLIDATSFELAKSVPVGRHSY
jgi:hypoxanthine phosphoribosyltransferase